MALDQGQGATANGAKADHHDRTGNFGIYRIVVFRHSFLLRKARRRSVHEIQSEFARKRWVSGSNHNLMSQ
jgi:hypothetical protein